MIASYRQVGCDKMKNGQKPILHSTGTIMYQLPCLSLYDLELRCILETRFKEDEDNKSL